MRPSLKWSYSLVIPLAKTCKISQNMSKGTPYKYSKALKISLQISRIKKNPRVETACKVVPATFVSMGNQKQSSLLFLFVASSLQPFILYNRLR